MLRPWKVGTLFGIPVGIHWSCLFLVVLALGAGLGHESMARSVVGAALIPAILTCVLLHEFGHCLTARAYGVRTRDITLYPIGGVARLEGLGRRPAEEIFIALAGPAVNVALALLLGVLFLPFDMGLVPRATQEDTPANLAGSFVLMLLLSNLMLAGFNLIPAFPMDGGRVLRALLQMRLGRLRATAVAAGLGLVFALLIAVGIPAASYYLSDGQINVVPVFVGLFVAYAGQRELAAVRRAEEARARAEEDTVLEALPVEGEPPAPLADAAE